MRISSIIDDLMYLKQNIATVKENLNQLDDVFNVLMNTQHCNDCLADEGNHANNQWFDDFDETVCSFKYQTCIWIRENEDDQNSNSALRSRSSRSLKHLSKSEKFSLSSKSISTKRAIKEKLRMAELMTEASFMEKKHSSRYEAEKPELEEKAAMLRAKVRGLDESELLIPWSGFPTKKLTNVYSILTNV